MTGVEQALMVDAVLGGSLAAVRQRADGTWRTARADGIRYLWLAEHGGKPPPSPLLREGDVLLDGADEVAAFLAALQDTAAVRARPAP